MIDNRTLVPVRAVSEAMKVEVRWEEASNTVSLFTKTLALLDNDSPCYPNSNIPAYSSVTNVRLKSSDMSDPDNPIYKYALSTIDAPDKYCQYLFFRGWILLSAGVNESNTLATYELRNDSDFITMTLHVPERETWVTYYSE